MSMNIEYKSLGGIADSLKWSKILHECADDN